MPVTQLTQLCHIQLKVTHAPASGKIWGRSVPSSSGVFVHPIVLLGRIYSPFPLKQWQ